MSIVGEMKNLKEFSLKSKNHSIHRYYKSKKKKFQLLTKVLMQINVDIEEI